MEDPPVEPGLPLFLYSEDHLDAFIRWVQASAIGTADIELLIKTAISVLQAPDPEDFVRHTLMGRLEALGLAKPPRPPGKTAGAKSAQSAGVPPVTPGLPISEYRRSELVAFVRWVDSDGVHRTDAQLLAEAISALRPSDGSDNRTVQNRLRNAVERHRRPARTSGKARADESPTCAQLGIPEVHEIFSVVAEIVRRDLVVHSAGPGAKSLQAKSPARIVGSEYMVTAQLWAGQRSASGLELPAWSEVQEAVARVAVDSLVPWKFNTGKVGYRASKKIAYRGRQYQAQVYVVQRKQG